MKNDDEALLCLALVLAGIGLFLVGWALWAVVSFVLAAIVAYLQYRAYLKEAKEEFDRMAPDLGVDLPVPDILESLGIEVPQEGGFETVADWLAGTPLGVSEEWPS